MGPDELDAQCGGNAAMEAEWLRSAVAERDALRIENAQLKERAALAEDKAGDMFLTSMDYMQQNNTLRQQLAAAQAERDEAREGQKQIAEPCRVLTEEAIRRIELLVRHDCAADHRENLDHCMELENVMWFLPQLRDLEARLRKVVTG